MMIALRWFDQLNANFCIQKGVLTVSMISMAVLTKLKVRISEYWASSYSRRLWTALGSDPTDSQCGLLGGQLVWCWYRGRGSVDEVTGSGY
jgi:hypothetical protein